VASPIDPQNAEGRDSRNGEKYAKNSPDLTANQYGENREKRVQVQAFIQQSDFAAKNHCQNTPDAAC